MFPILQWVSNTNIKENNYELLIERERERGNKEKYRKKKIGIDDVALWFFIAGQLMLG